MSSGLPTNCELVKNTLVPLWTTPSSDAALRSGITLKQGKTFLQRGKTCTEREATTAVLAD